MGYSAPSKRRSSSALAIVAVLHFLFIYIAVHFSSHPPQTGQLQTVIQLIPLRPEVKPIDRDIAGPAPAIGSTTIHLELQAPRAYLFEAEISEPSPSYEELPRANRALQMFDPRLQKKLEEAAERNSRIVTTLESSWMDATGNSRVKLGNGKCLRSVAPTKPGEATNWQLPSNCGKSESDKMLENMEREWLKSKR